jgi:hypothetical protein
VAIRNKIAVSDEQPPHAQIGFARNGYLKAPTAMRELQLYFATSLHNFLEMENRRGANLVRLRQPEE